MWQDANHEKKIYFITSKLNPLQNIGVILPTSLFIYSKSSFLLVIGNNFIANLFEFLNISK